MTMIERFLKTRVKSHRVPKRPLALEAVMFHVCGGFCTLVAYLLLYLADVDPLLSASLACTTGLAVFVLMFRLNNHLFARDRGYIEDFIASNQVDCMDLLNCFFVEIRERFARKGINYNSGVTPGVGQADIDSLFVAVFHEDGPALGDRFRSSGGVFYIFLMSLTQRQREVLYRYYLDELVLVLTEKHPMSMRPQEG